MALLVGCCGVLQCVEVCCSVLRCVVDEWINHQNQSLALEWLCWYEVGCCGVLQCVAVCSSVVNE